MVNVLEILFPGLSGTAYQITSPANDVYNCIAWAAGSTFAWWWPVDAPGNYWPKGVERAETLTAFQALFETVGYSTCADADSEVGFEKVAIFADNQGSPTHAARQLANGRWTSKLGKLEDIEHDLAALAGLEYGSVAIIMKRTL